jgi:hypothetical protein
LSYYPHLLYPRPQILQGQFVFSRREELAPPGWKVESHGSWILAYAPDLPCVSIVGGAGELVGWILGYAITSDGKLAQATLRLKVNISSLESDIEEFVDSLGGRYLVILFAGPTPRVYPDPFAMLAAVYAPEEKILASTSGLIPRSAATPFQLSWISALDIPYRSAMYPLGLTPRRGIERLLPNHFLDIGSWVQIRRWPRGALPAVHDTSAAEKRIAELAKRAIRAIAEVYPIQSPLTAGRDSRVLLACAREVIERVSFFTAYIPDETGWRDVVMAKAIAARFQLRHSILPYRRAGRSHLREWVDRTGGETGEGRGWRSIRTFRQVDPRRAVLIGWAGDIARPIWWSDTSVDTAVTPERILEICQAPRLPDFVARAHSWLESIPTRTGIKTIDLLFAEQRGGCWAGVIEYAEDGGCPARLAPLCHPEIVRTMMCLPEGYRRGMSLESAIIGSNWPELLEHPFNDAVAIGGGRKLFYRVRRSISGRLARYQNAVRKAHADPSWLRHKLAIRLD